MARGHLAVPVAPPLTPPLTPRITRALAGALERERERLLAAPAGIAAYPGARRAERGRRQAHRGPGTLADERLTQVDAALERLARGRYGACERCGQPIDLARLHALPWTRVCRRCIDREARANGEPGAQC